MAIVALDVGGTNVRAGLFAAPGQVLATVQAARRSFGTTLPVEGLAGFVDDCLASWEPTYGHIGAIGLAAAAVIEPDTGYVQRGENLGWRDLPLGDILTTHWQRKVAVDCDAFCGALAEARYGSGRGMNDFLYVVIGTGIGHALVLDGAVRHGVNAAANVFGHLKVVLNGEPCYCGGRGCLCQYASGEGLARVASGLSGQSEITAPAVISAYLAGTAWAVAAVEQWLDHVALALSSVYNLLDIDCTVLGGGVVGDNFPDLAALQERLLPLVYPQIRPVTLRRAALAEHSVLMGAAALAFDLEKRGDL